MKNKILVLFGVVLFSLIAFITTNNRKDNNMIVENTKCTEVCAKHILVETEEKAKAMLEDIKAGKISFEDSAKKESKCPSGKDGGNLGYFKRGMMVKEFEEAAFSAKKDEVCGPIKTNFGWHLIKVTDKR